MTTISVTVVFPNQEDDHLQEIHLMMMALPLRFKLRPASGSFGSFIVSLVLRLTDPV